MFSIRGAPVSSEQSTGLEGRQRGQTSGSVSARWPPPYLLVSTTFPTQLSPFSPTSCTGGKQRRVRTTTPRMLCFCLRSRAGWECCALQPAFPLAKEREEWARPLKAPSNHCTTVLPSACLVPCRSLCALSGRRAGAEGKPVGALGSGSAWGQSCAGPWGGSQAEV